MQITFGHEVASAIENHKSVVALESTVIAHGLPYPQNLETALGLEEIVRSNGATPATIAVFNGEFCVGLDSSQIERLATSKDIRKISRRDKASDTFIADAPSSRRGRRHREHGIERVGVA